MQQKVSVDVAMTEQAKKLAEEGKHRCFCQNHTCAGLVAVADTIKEDSPQAVAKLREMGIRVIMLTGDNERTAKAIGAQAGVDEVIAGVLPEEKRRRSANSENTAELPWSETVSTMHRH